MSTRTFPTLVALALCSFVTSCGGGDDGDGGDEVDLTRPGLYRLTITKGADECSCDAEQIIAYPALRLPEGDGDALFPKPGLTPCPGRTLTEIPTTITGDTLKKFAVYSCTDTYVFPDLPLTFAPTTSSKGEEVLGFTATAEVNIINTDAPFSCNCMQTFTFAGAREAE